jgi:hypothetical protein
VWRGPEKGSQVDATNHLLAALRRIVVSVIGAENVLHWATGFVESPDNIEAALRPNSTLADWEQLEQLVARAFSSNLTAKYSPGIDNLQLYIDTYIKELVPSILGGPVPIQDIAAVLRDYPFSETVYASEAYLAFLQKHPFVTIISSTVMGNLSFPNYEYSFNTSYFEVKLRGLSAFGADWKKPFVTGFFSEDDPLLKVLTDPTVCCEANKTQLLIQRALATIATQKYSIGNLPPTCDISSLTWLLPIKESIVPKWVSRSLLKVSVDSISLLRHDRPNKKMTYLGYHDSLFHVRCTFVLIVVLLLMFYCQFVESTNVTRRFTSTQWIDRTDRSVSFLLDPPLRTFGPRAIQQGEMPDAAVLRSLISPIEAASKQVGESLSLQDLVPSSPLSKAVKARNWPLVLGILGQDRS